MSIDEDKESFDSRSVDKSIRVTNKSIDYSIERQFKDQTLTL